MANGFSAKLPLSIDPDDGISLNKNVEDVARQNLKNLLLTSPRERIMETGFGVGLRNYLFEQDTPTLHSRISSKIYEQVSKYLSYLDIIDIEFKSAFIEEEVPNFVGIIITYKIKPLEFIDKLDLSVDQEKLTLVDTTDL